MEPVAKPKKPKVSPQPKKKKQFYGITEWYGNRYAAMSYAKRKELADTKNTDVICPYFDQVPTLGPKPKKDKSNRCNKKGGICSLRNFHPPLEPNDELTFGPIVATCPNRFLEDGVIIRHISEVVLQTETPLFAKEISFLMRPKTGIAAEAEGDAVTEEEEAEEVEEETGTEPAAPEAGREDVGRIDMVFVDPANTEKWCAVEMQAVYFSGKSMALDLAVIRTQDDEENGTPMPGAARHPDFRSSGPKRLMPQLMIKVPTLRRWGKKMVVVIDEPFLDSMSDMEEQKDISNCDIVWVVVRFEEEYNSEKAKLVIHKTVMTTLDDAVKALTSGTPTTLGDFETKLQGKLRSVFPE